ncbi:MAG: hypothetical protein AAF941_06910 [Pseudomonadota bacterium]
MTTDTLDHKGRPLRSKGQELFSVYSDFGPIFCDARQSQPGVTGIFAGQKRNKQVCFHDENSDGVFDSYFIANSKTDGLPVFSGDLPKKPKAVSGASYDRIAPETMGAVYFVGVEYRGRGGLTTRQEFETVFGTQKRNQKFSKTVKVEFDGDPVALTEMGADFSLVGLRDGAAEVIVRKTIPRQYFSVLVFTF